MINFILATIGFLIPLALAGLVTWWIGKRVYIVGHYWLYARWKR